MEHQADIYTAGKPKVDFQPLTVTTTIVNLPLNPVTTTSRPPREVMVRCSLLVLEAKVLQQYPLARFAGSPQKAFLQVDADSMATGPGRGSLFGTFESRNFW